MSDEIKENGTDSQEEQLQRLRDQIDALDHKVIALLNDRVKTAAQIGHIKSTKGSPIYVPSREEQVFEKLLTVNQGPLDEKAIRTIYREIISAAISLEKSMDIAFLGPEATYTHQAAMKNFGQSVSYKALPNIADVFTCVERGEADYGVIPVENSTEGAVLHSFDLLAETDLKIVNQVYLRIEHCLISNSPLDKITSVRSKDNALGQCRQWLARELPSVEVMEISSTAEGVLQARDHEGVAAIASRVASTLYDVPVVAEGIQDRKDNFTRFLVIGRETTRRLGDGRDKSSFVFSLKDRPGALLRALSPFSTRGINMTKIESRPSRKKAWDYLFFIDVFGHFEDPEIQDALKELESVCESLRWLGSYPNVEVGAR